MGGGAPRTGFGALISETKKEKKQNQWWTLQSTRSLNMPWSAFLVSTLAEWSNIELIHTAMAESRNWLQRLEEEKKKKKKKQA